MILIDEDSHNYELGKQVSIFGNSHELIYIDEDNTIRLAVLSPINCFVVYNSAIIPKPIAAIYFNQEFNIDGEPSGYSVLVYSTDNIYQLQGKELDKLAVVNIEPHYFKQVPVIEYKNNEENIGDFRDVIGLVKAYEQLQSNRCTDKQQFVDRLLVLTNTSLGDTQEEFERSKKILKEGGILELVGEGNNVSAQFISQTFNENEVEVLRKSIENDVFRMARIPNLADENFGNTASGISLKYKLFGTETLAGTKERYFKKGLRERINIINNIYNLKNTGMNLSDIDIIMERNMPIGLDEKLTELQGTEGLLSLETRLARYDSELNVAEEVRRLNKEKQDNFNMYSHPQQDDETLL
jgi:SPP1 family phage portal protein